MGVFCDRLKLCSIAALDCQTGQNKGRYRKKELSFLLVLLVPSDSQRIPVIMFGKTFAVFRRCAGKRPQNAY